MNAIRYQPNRKQRKLAEKFQALAYDKAKPKPARDDRVQLMVDRFNAVRRKQGKVPQQRQIVGYTPLARAIKLGVAFFDKT